MLADKIGMCLTIPKKVIKVKKNSVIIEGVSGARQEMKTIVSLGVGDFCLTQQNVAIEKISAQEAQEILNVFLNREEEKYDH